MHKKLSFSRFSLNTILRRHHHKRTNSLPESALLNSSHDSFEDPRNTFEDESMLSTTNEEASTTASTEERKKFQPGAAVKLERYTSELGLPNHEKVLKVCPCFMVSDLLVQGCLMITEKHLCFCSNIFGHKRNKKIRFEDIIQVTKEKVYALFPTGIGVRTQSEKITFSSATSRTKLIRLLLEQCRKLPSRLPDCDQIRVDSTVTNVGEVQRSGGLKSLVAATRVKRPDLPCADSISTTDLLAPEDIDNDGGSVQVTSPWQQPPQQPQQLVGQGQQRTQLRQHLGILQRKPPQKSTAGRPSLRPSANAEASWFGALGGKSALNCIAIVLALCGLAALYLAWRLSRMQQELAQLVSIATSARGLEHAPEAANGFHSSSIGPMNTDRKDIEIDGVINAVSGLHIKLLQMRQLLLQLLVGSSNAANGSSSQNEAA